VRATFGHGQEIRLSLRENVGYDAVVGALNRQVETRIDWEQVDDLSTVGIDEIAMSKGRKTYAAIITARQKDGKVQILAVLPDRKRRQREPFWSKFLSDCVPPTGGRSASRVCRTKERPSGLRCRRKKLKRKT
jgi:hypothetical protein